MIPQNPYKDDISLTDGLLHIGWQRCVDDYKEWLFSPCTDLKHRDKVGLNKSMKYLISIDDQWYIKHRYQCSECMKELGEAQ